jgi:2-aminoadipate transaminase
MDQQEVAHALGELERKLEALERTLSSIAADAPPPPPAASATPASANAVAPAPPYGPAEDASPASAPGTGRIVDESVEAEPVAPAAAPPSRPEPEPRPATGRAPLPPAAAARPGPPASTSPGSAGPGPEELLRFRERLEHTALELTRDYDRLLGRLSYAAVQSPPPATISFARGVPSLDIIDVEGLRDAAVRAFESDPGGATAYGTSVGYPRLRNWIAGHHGVEPERVLVTNGSLQADAFLFDQLVAAGDEVIVESPTYDRTLLSLRHRGARVHAVDLQPDGIDTTELARLLAAGANVRLAHVIPNFQNPAGYTLSLEKRRAMVELAAAHDFHVLEDDPYVELRFSGEPLPTMLSMDPVHVVYASSFTKTVCPGVRVGYLVGPADLISGIAKLATNTYISPGMAAQAIVYEFAASGALERSIETVKTALGERSQVLCQALARELPEASFVPPQGGYFLWVTLPQGTDVESLFRAAADRGVAFVKGGDFLLEGGENTLRLAYSGVTVPEIEEGVRRLADAYRSL